MTLAIDSKPGPVCFSVKFSSGNLSQYIEKEPVPSPLIKSPPENQDLVCAIDIQDNHTLTHEIGNAVGHFNDSEQRSTD